MLNLPPANSGFQKHAAGSSSRTKFRINRQEILQGLRTKGRPILQPLNKAIAALRFESPCEVLRQPAHSRRHRICEILYERILPGNTGGRSAINLQRLVDGGRQRQGNAGERVHNIKRDSYRMPPAGIMIHRALKRLYVSFREGWLPPGLDGPESGRCAVPPVRLRRDSARCSFSDIRRCFPEEETLPPQSARDLFR